MEKLPVILLPGLLSDDRVFHYQLSALNKIANMQVIPLTDIASPEAMTKKILRAAPERFALIGHSIGGWVALKIMEIAPNRVTKLCILNTSAREANEAERISRQLILDRIAKGEFYTIALEIVNAFVFNHQRRQEVLEMFLDLGENVLNNQTRAMMIRENLQAVLPKIHCQTLVVHAEQDKRFTLQDLKEISDAIPGAALKIISQSGHMSPMEQPEVITHLIKDWLVHDSCFQRTTN